MQYYLAIDLGAGSGRGIVYYLENGLLNSREVHRFSGYDIRGKEMFWDIQNIFDNILTSITNSYSMNMPVSYLGIDTWGVDYGVVTKEGKILNPYHYRDSRTVGVINEFDSKVLPTEEIFSITGIAPNEFNTLYQLYKGVEKNQFANASKVGFISNILGYMLTGKIATEPTITSTSAFYNKNKGYSKKLLEAIKFDSNLLPSVLPTNTILGAVKDSIIKKLHLNQDINYVLTPAHDTAAAISAIPHLDSDKLFLSAGTWSLFGTLLEDYNATPTALSMGYSNELGVQGVRFLRNITGFWIIQECLKDWRYRDPNVNIVTVNESVNADIPSQTLIDIGDSRFTAPENMLKAIHAFVAETGQAPLNSISEIANCIYTSLAMEYKCALNGLETISNKKYKSLNIFGGGCQNSILCTHTANALNLPVLAGVIEASSLGNAISQMIASNELNSLADAHNIIAATYPIKEYTPKNTEIYEKLLAKYLKIKSKK